MSVVGCTVHKCILLTGAGASWSFGGLLGAEFRERLFNRVQVQARSRIRDLLIAEPLFEEALGIARTKPGYDAEDNAAIESAITEVFAEMDRDIADHHHWRGAPVDANQYRKFLQRFQAPASDGKKAASFVFTLNQDLLLERVWYSDNHGVRPKHHPGIPPAKHNRWFQTSIGDYRAEMVSVIPANPSLELAPYTNYIKLHGSINWKAGDGANALVIGTGKPEQIARFPILEQYHQIFQQVLLTRGARILIHGYSFQDEHINRKLSDACRTSDLQVYLWDTRGMDLLYCISRRADCLGVDERIRATWSAPMSEVFPASQSETSLWREIRDKFFQTAY
ncbi:MAG: SIR2 family protein [Fimbriimonadaceae bacterium]